MSMTNHMPTGASYELRSERTKSTSVQYSGNKFERISSTDNTAHALRLLHEGKITTVASTKPGSAEDMMKQAAETVRYGSKYDETFAEKTEIKPLSLYDSADMSAQQMIDTMGGLVADLQAVDRRLVVGGSLTHTVTETALQTSSGFNHSYRKSTWYCSPSIGLVQGDDRLGIWMGDMSMRPDLDLKKLKDNLAQKLEWAKNVVPFEAGAYPVIFTPGQMSYVLNPVVQSLSGTAIQRKISPWGDKLGQELLDPRVTIIDDGSLDNTWTSKPFDTEGTPTQRNTLVENGRIKDILLNRKVAAQLGKKSTGNASLMGPAANFLMMEPGNKTFDELVKSIDYGMIIDGSMGAWSGNPYAGIVTGTISMGLKIVNGKIIGRVKDCMFTVNAFVHLAKHLAGCSSEREYNQAMMGTPVLLPYVMLDEVVISAK